MSWVVCGARASQVNGNRLWQELQQQYPSLTGQGERSVACDECVTCDV